MSEKSLWHETKAMPEFSQLKGNIKTDVLIIGGGISGILTAYFLKNRGVDCVLLEKDRICSGTTGNTTAKITYQHGLIYDKLCRSKGVEIAQGYYRANLSALNKFAEIADGIDCDFERKNSFVYTTNSPQKIERELKAMQKIGCKAEYAVDLPIPVKTMGAVMVKNQAQYHPLKFIAAISKDLNIFENSRVIQMVGNTAITSTARVKADKVIVCTHFPFINKHGLYFAKLYQDRSYVIAIENAQDVNGMYIDENKKGLSFRNYKDLLLLGGGAHRTGKQGGSYRSLRGFKDEAYPNSKEVYRWAAQDCMSLDDMPYIGRYSLGSGELYTATGFNKWGMSGSMLAAMMLSDEVLGVKNSFHSIFSPPRSMLTPQLFANLFESCVGLLTPGKRRCPHLGCALKWNPDEHTWDCPCHGSRFTRHGRVLDNPANGDMKM